MELSGKKTLVLGAGKSGIASARFVAERGGTVALYDKKPIETWSDEAKSLKDLKVGLIDQNLPSWLLDQIDLVVISPGVPTNSIPARYVDRKDGEVIGEVELAYRFLKGKIVGITGSNGKTTTTTLISELLKNSGIETQIGGNIGTPLLNLTENSTAETWSVVELSSFQLETIKDFRANVAVATNVTPNHLDRYDFFSDYAAAKHRLFMNQTSEDVAILNADDEITASWAKGLNAPCCWVVKSGKRASTRLVAVMEGDCDCAARSQVRRSSHSARSLDCGGIRWRRRLSGISAVARMTSARVDFSCACSCAVLDANEVSAR